jgi:hypothetical protein
MITEGGSPTNSDAPLQYFTVDSYEWPKEPPRPKRPRLATDEQKRRHRDDQKRFMQRKRAQYETLRHEAALTELQFKYLEALRDEKKLRDERRELDALQQVHFAASIHEPSVSRPTTPIRLDARNRDEPQTELDSILVDLLFSL